jgi:hypothetical protein
LYIQIVTVSNDFEILHGSISIVVVQ